MDSDAAPARSDSQHGAAMPMAVALPPLTPFYIIAD